MLHPLWTLVIPHYNHLYLYGRLYFPSSGMNTGQLDWIQAIFHLRCMVMVRNRISVRLRLLLVLIGLGLCLCLGLGLFHKHKYSQRAFVTNNWCLHLPLCVHTGVNESTSGNHLHECSCTLALSTNCLRIHASSWTRGRLFISINFLLTRSEYSLQVLATNVRRKYSRQCEIGLMVSVSVKRGYS